MISVCSDMVSNVTGVLEEKSKTLRVCSQKFSAPYSPVFELAFGGNKTFEVDGIDSF
jgi:hypothetical protein